MVHMQVRIWQNEGCRGTCKSDYDRKRAVMVPWYIYKSEYNRTRAVMVHMQVRIWQNEGCHGTYASQNMTERGLSWYTCNSDYDRTRAVMIHMQFRLRQNEGCYGTHAIQITTERGLSWYWKHWKHWKHLLPQFVSTIQYNVICLQNVYKINFLFISKRLYIKNTWAQL